jgi:hypothetical protein
MAYPYKTSSRTGTPYAIPSAMSTTTERFSHIYGDISVELDREDINRR